MAQPVSVFLPLLKGEVGGEAARRGQFRYKIKAKKIAVLEPLSQCCALPAPLSGEPKNKRHRAGTKIIPYRLMKYVLFLHVYAWFSAQPQSFSAQQKSSATSRISSARGGASLFSLSCPAQAQRSGLTSFSVRSSVWLRLQLQTLPVRWEPEQLQTHPWFSVCC